MASKLHESLRIEDPDGFYEALIELHASLTPEQSQSVNAELILLLANEVGDRRVLDEILEVVRAKLEAGR